jgi:hypothetical protein
MPIDRLCIVTGVLFHFLNLNTTHLFSMLYWLLSHYSNEQVLTLHGIISAKSDIRDEQGELSIGGAQRPTTTIIDEEMQDDSSSSNLIDIVNTVL